MRQIISIFKSAIADFSRNKGRTFLTSLGILIGVGSVVLLIAFGLGLKNYIQQQFDSLGTNIIRVIPGQVLKNGSFNNTAASMGSIRFEDKDVEKLKLVQDTEFVVPVVMKSSQIKYGGNSEFGTIYLASEGIFPTLNVTPDYGEVFTKSDVDKRSKVIVLGPKLAEKLFEDGGSALGQSVQIETQSFRVIGVLTAKGGGGFGGPDFDSMAYIPYKSALTFNPDKKYQALIVKGTDTADSEELKAVVKDTLIRNGYKEDDFSVLEQKELLNAISSIFAMINLVLVGIAAISLIVGGIGIMNIMYVTVSERTREIGIRRAIGARKSDVLSQFILESVLLSCLGGLLGVLLAYLAVLAIRPYFPAEVNMQSVLLAFGVSSLIGIVFGVFPAKKAADLSPMEAIRYE